jgi:hypothetical protein
VRRHKKTNKTLPAQPEKVQEKIVVNPEVPEPQIAIEEKPKKTKKVVAPKATTSETEEPKAKKSSSKKADAKTESENAETIVEKPKTKKAAK